MWIDDIVGQKIVHHYPFEESLYTVINHNQYQYKHTGIKQYNIKSRL